MQLKYQLRRFLIFLYISSKVALGDEANKTNCPFVIPVGIIGEFAITSNHSTSRFGKQIKQSVKTALAAGKCFTPVFIDTFGNLANIVPSLNKYHQSGIKLFVGLGLSSKVQVSLPFFRTKKALLCTPTASKSGLGSEANNVVQMFPTNEAIANAVANHLNVKTGSKLLVVYSSVDPYSSDIVNHFLANEKVKLHDIKTLDIKDELEVPSILNSVNDVRSFDTIFIPLFEMNSARVLGWLAKNHWDGIIYGSDAWGTDSKILRSVSVPFKEIYLPKLFSVDSTSPTMINFMKYLNRTTEGAEVTDLAAFTYDCINLFEKMSSIEKCSPNEMVRNPYHCLMRSLPFQSNTGTISSTKELSLQREVKIVRWGNGQK